MVRVLVFVSVVAACGSDLELGKGGGGGGGGGKGVTTEPKELTLKMGDRTVKVKIGIPKGWSEQVMDHARYYQGSWMSKFAVSVTCHGSCDTIEQAKKNIAQQAEEHFTFVSSKNHIPQLVATWVKKPAEDSPGTWSWRFRAENTKEKQTEDQFSIDRIIKESEPTSTQILTCNAEIDEREPAGVADLLEKACKELTYEVSAKPPEKK
jgi:hypothetical protein